MFVKSGLSKKEPFKTQKMNYTCMKVPYLCQQTPFPTPAMHYLRSAFKFKVQLAKKKNGTSCQQIYLTFLNVSTADLNALFAAL